jgi:hypothetical protein
VRVAFLSSSGPLGAGVRAISGPSCGLGPAVRALECMCFKTLPLAEGQRGPDVKPTLFSMGQGFLHGWLVRALSRPASALGTAVTAQLVHARHMPGGQLGGAQQ